MSLTRGWRRQSKMKDLKAKKEALRKSQCFLHNKNEK